MPYPVPGDPAPDFEMTADDGSVVSLALLAGRRFVLYFYPKDDTSGCTAQACGLRDEFDAFRRASVEVYGVSPDSVRSHVRFREKYGLPFSLLADPEHEAANAYGVWVERNSYGKKSMGIKRSTFVIDEDGIVRRAMYGVKPDGHPEQVLAALA